MADLGSIGRLHRPFIGSSGVGSPSTVWGGGRLHRPFWNSWQPPVEESTWPTYLTRPVFPWAIDWISSVSGKFEVQVNEVDAGFGDVTFWRDMQHVVQGWQFSFPLVGEQVADCEQFFEELQGRRLGFWVQTPVQAFRIVDGVSNIAFRAKDRNAAENWQEQPALYVSFTKAGQTTQRAKVSTVTDAGNGTETVVLTTSLEVAVDETWQAWVLAYVRLSDDVERGVFEGELALYRSLRVVELPHEYAAFETGLRPVFLYLFEAVEGGSPVQWRFTSFAWDIDDGTNVWEAKRITHGSMRRSSDAGREEATIEMEFEPTSPMYQMVPPAIAMPLLLTIFEADYLSPENKTTLFTGRVLGPVELEGKTAKARVSSVMDLNIANVPAMVVQQRCNYRVFQADTCRLIRASWEIAVTISNISNRTVTVTGAGLAAIAADWFAEGFIEVGSGSEFERRTILTSTVATGTTVVLTLNHPFFFAVATDAAVLIPGCDGTADTCINKFSNFRNFGGHRYAFKNLAVKALAVPEIDAAKK